MTYAENLLKWRVGCFNIDATRVGGSDVCMNVRPEGVVGSVNDDYLKGRFPANLILEAGEPCRLMDEQANQGASRFFIQIESEPNE